MVAGEEEDDRAGESGSATVRPTLDVPPLAAWWVIAAGIVVALLFVLTDHMLRATATCGGTLLLAAVLRLAIPGSKAGGIAVRGPLVDTLTLVTLATAVLVSGFTLDLTAR